MGFSQVGAAAIVATAALVAGYDATAAAFDADHQVLAARDASLRLEADALRSAIAVTSVAAAGGTVDVYVSNTGSATLDAAEVDLLLDGVPAAVALREVDGAASSVWAPLAELRLQATAGAPSDVVVAAGTGALAFWRA